MSEYITFARPYARAIYDLAKEEERVAEWGKMLKLIAGVAAQLEAAGVYGDPRFTDPVLAQIIIDACGDGLNREGGNLVHVLVKYRRLPVLGDLVALFEHLRAQGENEIEAEVVSARPLTEAQRMALKDALKQRFGCDVTLDEKEDESLLGGAVIRVGDLVIDGSLKGRLGQFARAIDY